MVMSELHHREFCFTWPYTIFMLCSGSHTYHACVAVPLVSFPDSGMAHIPYQGSGNETTVPTYYSIHTYGSLCMQKRANHSYLWLYHHHVRKIPGSPHLDNFNVCVPEHGSLGMRLGCSLTLVVNCFLYVQLKPNKERFVNGPAGDSLTFPGLAKLYHLWPPCVTCNDTKFGRAPGNEAINLIPRPRYGTLRVWEWDYKPKQTNSLALVWTPVMSCHGPIMSTSQLQCPSCYCVHVPNCIM